MTFLKSDKLMIEKAGGEVGTTKYYIFLDNFCLKRLLVLKISLGIFF